MLSFKRHGQYILHDIMAFSIKKLQKNNKIKKRYDF